MKYLTISLLLLLGFSPQLKAGDNGWQSKNEIIMGVSPDYPPFEFLKDGEVQGFDVDLALELGKKLGKKVKIIQFDFASLIPALNAGKVDFVPGMAITEERMRNVDFTQVYYKNHPAIIFLESKAIVKLDDLKGKRIAVQLGSTMEQDLNRISSQYDIEIMALTNNNIMIQELLLGRIDGVFIEEVQSKSFIKANPKLLYKVLDIETGDTGCSIALRKGSDLLIPLSAALEELEKDGVIKDLIVKWFETPIDTKSELWPALIYIPWGILVTLKYALVSIFFGSIIGTILALFKICKIRTLNYFAQFYTSIFRGTPLLVQLSLVYFALPQIIGVDLPPFAAGVIAFSLNSGAYISEILRAGIGAVDKGQFEAAKALGISYKSMMRFIILPQAVKKILPSLVNEGIDLLKESALISVIGEADIMRRASIVAAEQSSYMAPLLVAALCYYVIVMILTHFANMLEKRLNH